MSHWYNNGLRGVMAGEIDMNLDDIRVALLMTNTTADTERDETVLSGFVTLDEFDGSGYARQALASEAVNQDNPNNRSEFDANDISFGALGAGTRQAAGMLVYKHVGADSANIPILWIDSGGFPFTGNGSTVNVTWNAEGIAQLVA